MFTIHPILKSLLVAALPLLASNPAIARDWQTDAALSTLTFKGTYQGGAFNGGFKKFDAVISYDDADLSKCTFDVKVDVASIDTASAERDDSLKGDEFFDPKKYPQAHFAAQGCAKTADGSIETKGTLTIRDQTKPVVLKLAFATAGNKATLDVDTVIKRLDFALGAGKDWSEIGSDVPVHGHLILGAK